MNNQNRFLLFTLGIVILTVIIFSGNLVGNIGFTKASENLNVYLPLVISSSEDYIVIGWSDLGMRYYDDDYSVYSILPPYSTVLAQVIKIGDPPQIVTNTVKVEYSIQDNTESASKINFWDYEDQLFGVDLPLNEGLKGLGLAGEMSLGDDGAYFIAEGIPVTEFTDSAPSTSENYQLVDLVVKEVASDEVFAQTTIVAPVSSGFNCFGCHRGHDNRADVLFDHKTNAELVAPVLCSSCHADPIIDEPGDPDRVPLSISIHNNHKTETSDCYDCHPGPQPDYWRGVMATSGSTEVDECVDCHVGGLTALGTSGRIPWSDEPRCEDCHDANHSENPGTLFRNSTGHGGMYCQSCHNSTHAILPSRETNDNLQSIALQGYAGQIAECTVCHRTEPTSGGPHIP